MLVCLAIERVDSLRASCSQAPGTMSKRPVLVDAKAVHALAAWCNRWQGKQLQLQCGMPGHTNSRTWCVSKGHSMNDCTPTLPTART